MVSTTGKTTLHGYGYSLSGFRKRLCMDKKLSEASKVGAEKWFGVAEIVMSV